jgi:hypothetical protein
MRPIETIPGIGRGGQRRIKKNDGWVNSTMIYCKNFCKCHNVLQYNNNERKERKEGRKKRKQTHL